MIIQKYHLKCLNSIQLWVSVGVDNIYLLPLTLLAGQFFLPDFLFTCWLLKTFISINTHPVFLPGLFKSAKEFYDLSCPPVLLSSCPPILLSSSPKVLLSFFPPILLSSCPFPVLLSYYSPVLISSCPLSSCPHVLMSSCPGYWECKSWVCSLSQQ